MEGHHRDTILENGVWLLGQEEMNISKLSFRVKVFLLSEKNIPDVFGASSAKNNVQKLKIFPLRATLKLANYYCKPVSKPAVLGLVYEL